MSRAHHLNEAEIDELALLFGCCARVLLKSGAPADFLDWIAEAGPSLAPGFASRVDPRTGPVGNFFRTLGVAIYGAMPLPANDFRPRKLPLPGRNEPCLCGSGRKYKQCCLAFGDKLDFRDYNLLRHVLECLPKSVFATLPATSVDRFAVWDVAAHWREEGELERAAALLEPWFAGTAPLPAALEPHFDELMDCYLDLGRPRKRERLVEAVLARGDAGLRSVGLQRRAAISADQGDFEHAWRDFEAAQRADPDNPAHASLELTLLAAEGKADQARERARFWLARLERRRDPGLEGIIDFVRAVYADPLDAIGATDRQRFPALERLSELLAAAPPLAVHYTVDATDDGERMLEPDAALLAFEAAWQEGFEQSVSGATDVLSWDDELADEPDFEDGLALLARRPLGWQSFEVLHGIAAAVSALPMLDGGAALAVPVLERAAALLELVLGQPGTPPGRLSWGWLENRAALSCLVELAGHALDDPARGVASEAFIACAERYLELNPTDNHYLREPLARAYLSRDRIADAVALTDRYPEDLSGSTLNRILAHYRAGDEPGARELLREAAHRHEVAIKMLLADKPRAPKPDSEFGITMGGKYEAWLYRSAARELWARDDALAWLGRTFKAAKR